MLSHFMKLCLSLLACTIPLSVQAGSPEEFKHTVASFEHSRSLEKAEKALKLAKIPTEKAQAFALLAEVYFAKGNRAKTLLYSLLSLAHGPENHARANALFYIQQVTGEKNLPLTSKQGLLAWLNEKMETTSKSQRFRDFFDMASVVGLLPDFPLKYEKATDLGQPLQLCLAFDENYAPHAAVTMLSAMLSAHPTTRYEFTVLEDKDSPISAKSKHKLYSLVNMLGAGQFSLRFQVITSEMLPKAIRDKDWGWPRIVFFKLLIPSVFSHADKVVWLDSDLIVRKDLSPLFIEPMGGKWLQGTRDIRADEYLAQQGLSSDLCYVNCGVLVMDTQAMRRDHSEDAFHQAFLDDPTLIDRIQFPEQDLIAIIYKGRIQEVGHQTLMKSEEMTSDSRWNCFAQKHPSTEWQNINHHFAGIIHMESGDIKPWKKGKSFIRWNTYPKKSNGIQNLYWALRDLSPWPVTLKPLIRGME